MVTKIISKIKICEICKKNKIPLFENCRKIEFKNLICYKCYIKKIEKQKTIQKIIDIENER